MATFQRLKYELISMAEVDQQSAMDFFGSLSLINNEQHREIELYQHYRQCHVRANRMVEIVNIIGTPSLQTIGIQGLKSVGLLTQHSYIDAMKLMLKILEKEFEIHPNKTLGLLLPPIVDRVMIIEIRIQRFGTQWILSENNVPFLAPLENFKAANNLRKKYKMPPMKKPVNLVARGAEKNPLGKGYAVEGDQKLMTDQEYDGYSKYYIKNLASNYE